MSEDLKKNLKARRSSILKLPKNSESIETENLSPETPSKLKRRVSFASKKHVKEFSEGVEQGTVWDSTYEENDSSSHKSHDSVDKLIESQSNKISLQFVSNSAKEFQVLHQIQPNDIYHNFVDVVDKENNPVILQRSLQIERSLVDNETPFSYQNNLFKSTTSFSVYCDGDEEKAAENVEEEEAVLNNSFSYSLPEQNLTNKEDTTLFEGEEFLDESGYKNNLLDISAAISLTRRSFQMNVNEQVQDKESVEGDVGQNQLTELDEFIESIDSQLNESGRGINQILSTVQSQSFGAENSYYSKMIESFSPLSQRSQEGINDSIEITETVSPTIFSQETLKSSNLEEESQQSQNVSMEMTEVILPSQSQQLYNNSMEMTEAIPSVITANSKGGHAQYLQNRSVEMTDVIQSLKPQLVESSMEISELLEDLRHQQVEGGAEKAPFFQDNSMEMTEPVAFLKPQQVGGKEEKTQLFQNKSMEMTKPVAFLKDHQVGVREEKTQFFQNKSMEMTEPVAFSKAHQVRAREEKTQLFQNKSMEMTEPVTLLKPHQIGRREEKTQLFQNKSMEMTEPVAFLKPHQVGRREEKTQLFQNKSMEMTEAISSLKPQQVGAREEKTQLFQNKSMEMTEPVVFSKPQQVCRREEKTQVFQNKSMEMTEAISSLKPQQAEVERDQSIQNMPMELTEAVTSENTPELEIGEPYNIENTSMEMTEAIPIMNYCMNYTNKLSSLVHNSNDAVESHDPEISGIMPFRSTPSETSLASQKSIQIDKNYFMELTRNLQLIKNISSRGIDENQDLSVQNEENQRINLAELSKQTQTFCANSENDKNLEHQSLCTNPKNDENISIRTAVEISGISSSAVDYQALESQEEKTMNLDKNQSVKMTKNVTISKENSIKNVSMNVEERSKSLHESPKPIAFGCDDDFSMSANNSKFQSSLSESLTDNNSFSTGSLKSFKKIYKSNLHDATTDIDCVETPDYIFNDTPSDDENENDEQSCNDNLVDQSSSIVDYSCQESPEKCSDSTFVSKYLRNEMDVEEEEEAEVEAMLTLSPKLNYKEDSPPEPSVSKKNPVSDQKKQQKSEKFNEMISKANLRLKSFKELLSKIHNQKTPSESKNRSEVVDESFVDQQEPKSPFETLAEGLKDYETRDDCIWSIHTLLPKIIVIEFSMTALLLEITFHVPEDLKIDTEYISSIKIIPRVSEEEEVELRITDNLISQKLNTDLKKSYTMYEDVPVIIENVSKEVESIYNFYFELKNLSRLNLMEISEERISLTIMSPKLKIILSISMGLKLFSEIEPRDIEVTCILGEVNPIDIKNLIKSVGRNHEFLSHYVTNVKKYIELIEETMLTNSRNL